MTLPAGFLPEQTCFRCGNVVREKAVRWRCPACKAENRPTRYTMPGGRARTMQTRELKRMHRHLTVVEEPSEPRPKTRGDCVDGPRPCPWIGCRYHLAFEVTNAGGLKEKFPGMELEELEQTCALDVADSGPLSLDSVAYLTNVTQERVRQIEEQGLTKLRDVVKPEDVF